MQENMCSYPDDYHEADKDGTGGGNYVGDGSYTGICGLLQYTISNVRFKSQNW